MLLNLHDPDSIGIWWAFLPDRHDNYLAYKIQVSPKFAPNINEARRRIAALPDLADLLDQAVQRRRRHETLQAECTKRLTILQLRHREPSTA